MYYTVIENTPGYLPEEDDPPVFTSKRRAQAYATELARSYREDSMPDDNGREECPWTVTGNARDGYAVFRFPPSPYDLGRVIDVAECDPPDDPESIV